MAATTINPALLNALTLKWGRTKADLDDQQNRRKINYNSALDKMRRNYDKTAIQSRVGFADRGMLHAGPSMQNQVDLRDEYNRQQGEATQLLNTDLATIARRRLETDQEYNINKILASMGATIPT